MPPQRLLPPGAHANRHEGAVVRGIGLVDRNERNPSAKQARADVQELLLVGHRERHGVGSVGQVARTALSRCVYDLSGLDPSVEVSAHDDVMGQGIVSAVGRFTVGESSWAGR